MDNVGRNKWQSKKLGDFFSIKHGYAFKGKYFSDDGPFIVLTPGNFFDEGGFKHKKKEKHYVGGFPSEYILGKDDLIVAMTEQAKGLLGSSALVPCSRRYLHNQRLGLIQDLDTKKLDKTFLYYLFNTRGVRDQIQASANGVKVRHTSPSRIYEIKFAYPPVPVQQKIAGILSAYDDLIENNTRRIAILEEMAQNLYWEWFVYFRFPGHEDAVFVERGDGNGRLPEGWSIIKLGDVCKIGRGSSPRPIKNQEYFRGGSIPWIKIADATKSGRYLYKTKQCVNEYGASFSRFLKRGSLILAASGTLGYTQFLGVDGCIHDGWLYLDEFDGISKFYLYQLFHDRQQYFHNSAYGAAIQNINTNILREMQVVLPSQAIQNGFERIILPIDQLIDVLSCKNANLRQTRDLLLPRLISGELDVSELDITGVSHDDF